MAQQSCRGLLLELSLRVNGSPLSTATMHRQQRSEHKITIQVCHQTSLQWSKTLGSVNWKKPHGGTTYRAADVLEEVPHCTRRDYKYHHLLSEIWHVWDSKPNLRPLSTTGATWILKICSLSCGSKIQDYIDQKIRMAGTQYSFFTTSASPHRKHHHFITG